MDAQSKALKIRTEAENPEYLLKPEMFVIALLETRSDPDQKSLIIPKSAVLWVRDQSVVYIQVGNRDNPQMK